MLLIRRPFVDLGVIEHYLYEFFRFRFARLCEVTPLGLANFIVDDVGMVNAPY